VSLKKWAPEVAETEIVEAVASDAATAKAAAKGKNLRIVALLLTVV